MAPRTSYITHNVDTEEEALGIFETFHAKDSKRSHTMNFEWPAVMRLVGKAEAQLYRSNKWKMDPHVFEDYKHIAEGMQHCYVMPGFLREYSNTSHQIPVYGPTVDMARVFGDPAPLHFAVLANLLAVQVCLYDEYERLPRGDDRLYEVTMRGGKLGGAKNPQNGKAFLFAYDASGICMVITGVKLDIQRDGIVG